MQSIVTPPFRFRAAPKKRFGRCSAFESIPPDNILPLGVNDAFGRGQTRDRIGEDGRRRVCAQPAASPFDNQSAYLYVGLVLSKVDEIFAVYYRCMSVTPLVVVAEAIRYFRMVLRNRVGDGCSNTCLTGARRRDQTALTFASGVPVHNRAERFSWVTSISTSVGYTA